MGSGNVGLATGQMLLRKNFRVWFKDNNQKSVNNLIAKKLNVYENGFESCLFGYIFICVPTPTIKNEMSTEYLMDALSVVSKIVNQGGNGPVIVVRSTILPGTMDKTVIPFFKRNVSHKNYGICYYPAFMRERRGLRDELKPWVSVIACDSKSTKARMSSILRGSGGICFVVKFREAELIKYGSNLFNALKISYFNQIFLYARTMNINGKKVAMAIAKAAEGNWNPDYGIKPGYPFDGKCLPKDLLAFITFLDKTKIGDSSLLKSILKINHSVQLAF